MFSIKIGLVSWGEESWFDAILRKNDNRQNTIWIMHNWHVNCAGTPYILAMHYVIEENKQASYGKD